jgi:hypothetical protein
MTGDVAFLLMIVVGLYFMPTLFAPTRHHHQRLAMAALNLLLGWTVLGWIAALVWSLTATPRR